MKRIFPIRDFILHLAMGPRWDLSCYEIMSILHCSLSQPSISSLCFHHQEYSVPVTSDSPHHQPSLMGSPPLQHWSGTVHANGHGVIKTLMASMYQFIMSCTTHSLRAVSCCRDHGELILRSAFSRNHEIIVSLGWQIYIIIKRSPAPVSGCPFGVFYKQVNIEKVYF